MARKKEKRRERASRSNVLSLESPQHCFTGPSLSQPAGGVLLGVGRNKDVGRSFFDRKQKARKRTLFFPSSLESFLSYAARKEREGLPRTSFARLLAPPLLTLFLLPCLGAMGAVLSCGRAPAEGGASSKVRHLRARRNQYRRRVVFFFFLSSPLILSIPFHLANHKTGPVAPRRASSGTCN